MDLREDSLPFLDYVQEWQANLKPLAWDGMRAEPQAVAVVAIDVINGFCYEGALASPRVAAIVAPIVRLFRQAHALGVHNFVLIQDTHRPNAVEFHEFAPHCVRGSSESKTVKELAELPFAGEYIKMAKNSIHPAFGTGFGSWLAGKPGLTTFLAVGDCTDLCTYQLAMYLKLVGNAQNTSYRVIVPADCVDTYDLPVSKAQELGIMPHDANLLHAVFLYHMALNGIEVVKNVEHKGAF